MATVRGCNLPDDLFYNVENNVWARKEGDGTLTIVMTSYACSLAGEIVSYTPKKVGREIRPGKSFATIESGKWVGPAKSAAGGEVVETNDALAANPSLANDDPYGQGWLAVLQPEDWETVKAGLPPGASVAPAYEAKMDADKFAGCE